MGDYKPPYTITNEMLSYVSSISEKIGRITATGHLESKPKYVVEESGDFRWGEEGVFHGAQCIFMAPPARFVPRLMEDLFDSKQGAL